MEFTGKTVREAIEEGLITLSLTEDQVDVVIKEEPTKGLFGRLKGKAVVEITPKAQEQKKTENPGVEGAKEFLAKVIEYLGYEAELSISNDGENDAIVIEGKDSSSIIGYRGEVLDALQTLASAVANIGNKDYKKIVVDSESYRERREETLISLAKKLEAKATEMRRDVKLEPMSPFERRIIHTALAESQTVKTISECNEPNRYVVIVPNDRDEFAKPYNAGRNERRASRDNRGRNGRRNGNRNDRRSSQRKNGGAKPQMSKSSSSSLFGTYLGNRFKDEN